ncbi:MAG: hypothetical protein EOM80_04850 [Erysipelotrichia bacterium]|nr:hypothetical protein [Erysipelotrichia bacterium]
MFADTLKTILAPEFADKNAIIQDDASGKSNKLTYKNLCEEVEFVSQVVRETGVEKGGRVIFVSENHLYWLPIFLGIAGSGAIAVPVDGNIAVERFHAIVEDCNPSLIIISRRFENRYAEFMLSGCKIKTTLNLYFDVFCIDNSVNPHGCAGDIKPHDIAAMVYTSGTTGKPKGIMLSHKAFVESVKLGTKISGYRSEDTMLALLPFTHVFALIDSGLVMLSCHSTFIVCNSFNPAEIMQVLLRHHATYLLAVPRLAELLAMGLMQAPELQLPSLTIIIGGAAPRPQIMKLMISRGIKTLQGFGMTETAAGVLIGLNAPLESVGKAVEGVKVKISNPLNGVGELLISTPTIFSGVFGQPELDETLFEGEYFKTGDLAEIDNDGYVYIRGRAKEVIISSSGLNVYPDELELRLGSLPYAEEYVIFGYCSDGLEIPAMALFARNDFFRDYSNSGKVHEFVEKDIRGKVANWPEAEKIRRIFIVDKPLPRSASAKIKRFEVAAMLGADPSSKAVEMQKNMHSESQNEGFFNLFQSEIANFLNVAHEKISLSTRLDSFMQLDSLGIIAMLIGLEKRFKVSCKDMIGMPAETFADLYAHIARKVDMNNVLADNNLQIGSRLPAMLDFSPEAVAARQQFVRDFTGVHAFNLPAPAKPGEFSGNIESFLGFVQVPVGICGPLKILGRHAAGEFYLPLATTEGALVSSVARGCQVITMSGGAQVRVVNDSIVRTPVFIFSDLEELEKFSAWINQNFAGICTSAESTTKHGKLKEIEHFPIGCQLILRFSYSTGDASGQNMTTIATRCAVDYILKNYPGKINDWFLESNLSGDKKINSINFTGNRGKKIVAVCRIPGDIVRKVLHTTPERMCKLADLSMLTSIQAHAFGVQAHYANTLAAVYIAAGQDPACVAESAAGITYLQMVEGDLQVSVTLPGIMVGTIGGGTRLPTQNSCLQIMQCAGAGNAHKFAEILAAGVLAGEISIIGAMASDEFTHAHASYGRSGGMNPVMRG